MITILKFLLVVVYVLCSLSLIFVVLLQQGKGAGMGASLGGGASQTLFGSRAPTFISRFTGVLAAGFFIGAMALAKWPPFTPDDAVNADDILRIEEVVPATTDDATSAESATGVDEPVSESATSAVMDVSLPVVEDASQTSEVTEGAAAIAEAVDATEAVGTTANGITELEQTTEEAAVPPAAPSE